MDESQKSCEIPFRKQILQWQCIDKLPNALFLMPD